MSHLRLRPFWLPLLLLCSCGARSSVDLADGDGFVSSGGSPSVGGFVGAGGTVGVGGALPSSGGRVGVGGAVAVGGAAGGPTGGSTGGGGAPTGGSTGGGGAPTGGSTGGGGAPAGGGPGYCDAGTYDADPGPELACRPWTDCAPGERLVYFGSPTSDQTCAPCPAGSFTEAKNEVSCAYGGCEFSELIVQPGTPTTPSSCAPDPQSDFFDPQDGSYYVEASSNATRAYLGIADASVSPLTVNVYGYEQGTRASEVQLAVPVTATPTGLATADDGTQFLATSDPYLVESAVSAWTPTGDPLWDVIVPDANSPTESFDTFLGVATAGANLITWGPVRYDALGSSFLPLGNMTQTGTELRLTHPAAPVNVLQSVAVDSGGGLWMLGGPGDGSWLIRMDSIDATPEPVPNAYFPYYYSYNTVIAAAPDGRGYAAWIADGALNVIEFDRDANATRGWYQPLSLPGSVELVALRVHADQAIFVAGNFRDYDEIVPSSSNVFALRMAMDTPDLELKTFVGPQTDGVLDLVVTGTGAVYLTGYTYGSDPYDYRPIYYIRQAF